MKIEFTTSEVELLLDRFVHLSVDVNIEDGNSIKLSKFFITAAFKQISVEGNTIVFEGNVVTNLLQKLLTTFNETTKSIICRQGDNMVIALDQIPEMRAFLEKFSIQSVGMGTEGVIRVIVI